MRIVCTNQGWIVLARWYGAERTVHTGTLIECVRYVKDSQTEGYHYA